MDLNSPSMSIPQVEQLLSDNDASQTCQKLLECYLKDKQLNLLDLQESIRSSNSFVSHTIKNGTQGIKKELDDLNHAIFVVDSLLNKNVINYTTEIIQSFQEINEYMGKLSDISSDLEDLNERMGSKYKNILLLYNSVESDTASLEKLRKVYLYSLECRKLILFLKSLHKRTSYLKSSVRDFLEMLLISHKCMRCLDRIYSLEKTEALLKLIRYCEDLKNCILKKVYNNAIVPLFEWNNNQNSATVDLPRDLEKRLVISQVIYKELSVSSKIMLELVENMIYEAAATINIKEVTSEHNYREWQGILISQISEFLLKYVRNQKSIYHICRSTRHSLPEKIDKNERELLSSYLETYVHEDEKEPYSLCELYTKRCVGVLHSTMSALNKEGERYDVVMLAPQLISLGDTMHAELNGVKITFNMHRYYFKTLCEEYAKSFVSVAAKKIIPVSKMSFLNCIRALPTLESSPTQTGGNAPNQAGLMLMNLPVDNELWTVLQEFLEKSKMCPALFKQICAIAASGLETVFANIAQVRSPQGCKLSLSDGGSKITLLKPNDAQILNARLFEYTHAIVHGIERKLLHLIPEDSPLLRVLDYGRSIPLIGSWAEDVASTVWHTASYISLDNQEFNWTCSQVSVASRNIVKILNFLKESYFEPLIPLGKYELLQGFASTTVASFLIYAVTIWPLSDEEKLTLMNSSTEFEFTLSEILQAKLPRNESENLSFFRRLIFLSDGELYQMYSEEACAMPRDVLLLHMTCRLLRDNGVKDRQLFKHMNFTNVHFMLQSFRTSLVTGQDHNSKKLRGFVSELGLTSQLYNDIMAHLNGF
ncbi:hypothetical protein MACJ_000086 [Theileria orientalis]|uniref:Uncharacterized protein n=1 Tax=Theileria orientalis TaxID=68886 RepID=A0A976M3H3_THEOR|nr:hypothetical protein MACJ_000086 [Theileria orientalis]